MKEAREKMTLREHVQIALRAVKRTFAFEKRYAVSLLMQAVLKAVIPYVPVYFSAKVIDALCAGGAVCGGGRGACVPFAAFSDVLRGRAGGIDWRDLPHGGMAVCGKSDEHGV